MRAVAPQPSKLAASPSAHARLEGRPSLGSGAAKACTARPALSASARPSPSLEFDSGAGGRPSRCPGHGGERGRCKGGSVTRAPDRKRKACIQPNPQGCRPVSGHLASSGRSRATVPTAAYITTLPTGTPRTDVPLAVWCFPLSRSQGGYCSTGPRARAAVRGSSPIRGAVTNSSVRWAQAPGRCVPRRRDQDRVRGEAPPLLPVLRCSPSFRYDSVWQVGASQPNDAFTPVVPHYLHSCTPPSARIGVHPVDDFPIELRESQGLVEGTRVRVVAVRHPLDPAAPSA